MITYIFYIFSMFTHVIKVNIYETNSGCWCCSDHHPISAGIQGLRPPMDMCMKYMCLHVYVMKI